MIKVEKAKSYRCCNNCNSNKNVVNITTQMNVSKNSTQGLQIALCEDCCKSLIEQLKVEMKHDY